MTYWRSRDIGCGHSAVRDAGPPPGAREDCSVSYDTKTCNLVFFGGWRQGWLEDLWCLNVAGVVGPPYAVQSVEPNTGPVTGNTPVVLHGIGLSIARGEQGALLGRNGCGETLVGGALAAAGREHEWVHDGALERREFSRAKRAAERLVAAGADLEQVTNWKRAQMRALTIFCYGFIFLTL